VTTTLWRRLMLASGAAATVALPIAGTAVMQEVPPTPRASDGQSLFGQGADTLTTFLAVWGERAGSRWVSEHEADLNRSRANVISIGAPTGTVPAAATESPGAVDSIAAQPGPVTPLATSIPTPNASPSAMRVETPNARTPAGTATPSVIVTSIALGVLTPARESAEMPMPAPSSSGSAGASSGAFLTPRPTPTFRPMPTAIGGSSMPSYRGYPGASTSVPGPLSVPNQAGEMPLPTISPTRSPAWTPNPL
jgi:hypothetical protein